MSQKEYYKEVYWDKLRTSQKLHHQTKHVKRLMDIFSHYVEFKSPILDIGCGTGSSYAQYIGEQAKLYVGADISFSALLQAQTAKLQGTNLDIEQTLPFKDNSFKSALCIDVLEHLFDPAALLKEIHRLLKPGAYMIVSVPNIAHYPHRLRLLGGKFVAGGLSATADTPWCDPHIRFFTIQSLKNILVSSGFKFVKILGGKTTLLVRMPILSPILGRILGRKKLTSFSELFEPLGYIYPNLFAGQLIGIAQKPIEQPDEY